MLQFAANDQIELYQVNSTSRPALFAGDDVLHDRLEILRPVPVEEHEAAGRAEVSAAEVSPRRPR